MSKLASALFACAEGQFDMSAMHGIAGLEGDNRRQPCRANCCRNSEGDKRNVLKS